MKDNRVLLPHLVTVASYENKWTNKNYVFSKDTIERRPQLKSLIVYQTSTTEQIRGH